MVDDSVISAPLTATNRKHIVGHQKNESPDHSWLSISPAVTLSDSPAEPGPEYQSDDQIDVSDDRNHYHNHHRNEYFRQDISARHFFKPMKKRVLHDCLLCSE
ncbi:hypothetical protein [Pseudomonas sp. MWU12-2323]|uniref:hypothetical protein n=1 Tax=Pseudomonas sp. MWU12-2323 TaxID=2651296 RepID=UPI00128B7DAB|nr:hypothetical protein [Pseudomonas sp. MWU12-2323]MPQ69342.1 hypothetical protein [Pseudomonas sp. MWU12-2323]